MKVFTAGETEDGAHYVVMEYAEGPTLHEELYRCGRIDEARAADIGAQIAGALSAAHQAGVVHRDLKPANVIITILPGGEDHVRVLDFGIAKLSQSDGGTALTASGAIVGTPAYMSPEQVSGADLDGRSDLYTLGVMLYEMVTGKHPYEADTPVQYIIQHLQEPMTPPEVRAPGLQLSDAFLDVLNRACAKAPSDRFASAEATRNTLRRAVERISSETDPATLAIVPSVSPPDAVAPPSLVEPPPPAASPSAARIVLPLAMLGLLFVGSVIGVIAFVLTGADDTKPTASAVEEPEQATRPAVQAAPPRERPTAAQSAPSTEAVPRPAPAPTPTPALAPTPPPTLAPPPTSASGVPPERLPVERKPPTEPRTPLPTSAAPAVPAEFSAVLDGPSGFMVPAQSHFRMRTAALISMDTPWSIEDVAEFLREEFETSDVMISDYMSEAEPWFAMILQDAPLSMIRVDPEGRGTRVNYFVNTNH